MGLRLARGALVQERPSERPLEPFHVAATRPAPLADEAQIDAFGEEGEEDVRRRGDVQTLSEGALRPQCPRELAPGLQLGPVTLIAQRGWEYRAYGHYYGDGIARDNYEDRIVLYQDTLERDFGHDEDLLRAQVVRTLRHELAHHLGWGERGVRELGL